MRNRVLVPLSPEQHVLHVMQWGNLVFHSHYSKLQISKKVAHCLWSVSFPPAIK